MISFKPVELSDKAAIERYTLPSECRNCDMAFANIYCWRHFHQTAWAEVEGFLVIRFLIDGKRRVGYMQPIGEGDFTPILPLLAEDARRNFGERLRLYGLCREGRRTLTDADPEAYAFDDDRALSDYIYLAEELRTLTGRRYQPKRNHLNRFFAKYNYRYEPLERRHFADCLRLEASWREERTSDEDSASMRFEQQALHEAFDHFEELGLHGGVLYVGEELVAFTYGSKINYDTFDCHIEKADTRYDGVFAAINKLFAESLPRAFTYINREEDMGLEGLRRSKLSYHPSLLWPKTTAILLSQRERALKELWQKAFGDEASFVEQFLMRYYAPEQMLSVEEGEELLSMAHLIPFRCDKLRVAYLYGVATAPEARHRGLATRLTRMAVEKAQTEGFDAVVLIPGSEELRHFYARLGFAGELPVRLHTSDGFDFGTGDTARDRAMVLPLHEITLPKELNLGKNENFEF